MARVLPFRGIPILLKIQNGGGPPRKYIQKKGFNPFGLTPFLNKSGAGGDRTRDLLNAIQARSQLRHSPNK